MANLLVPIASFKKLHVAAFIKEKFQLEGIECFLTDEGFETVDEGHPTGYKVKVNYDDIEKAVQVLLKVHKEFDIDKIRSDSSMKDKRKILVPIDLSNYSMNALEYAFGIAGKTGAEVKILNVYKDPTQLGPVKHTTSWEKHEKIEADEAYNNAQTQLLKFRDKINQTIDKKLIKNTIMHFSLLKGRPENVIISVCNRYKPDLVIMAPKGKEEQKGSFIGSVTTNVIEHTGNPVLTIPKSASFKGLDLIDIMYATDFYESDNKSLNKLLEIVAPYKTNIHCIHIDIEHNPLKMEKVDELNLLLKKEYSAHKIECKLFESYDLMKGFNNFVKENNIDVISFSSPKRTMFYKIFHTNQLKRMVSTSKIPMLVFPV